MRKLLVSILTFSLLLESASLSFAKPKKKVRQADGKAKKSGSKRSGSSKSGAKKSSKRSSSSRRAAAIRASAASATVVATGSEEGGSTASTEVSTGSTKAANCRTAYSECMDIQIRGILSKYTYLGEDPAVEAIQETGDPLRCVYYYNDDAEVKIEAKAAKKETKNEDFAGKTEKKAKNVNSLYYAYNYYCKPELGVGEAGQPINECQWDTSNNTNATPKSYAFYKEAYDRLQADELTILNFSKTKLYTDKIQKMLGSDYKLDLEAHSISTSDVDDMLKQLGLDTSTNAGDGIKLFSVTVTPPVGAGALNPKGVFQKAHEICMGNGIFPTTASSGLSESDLEDLKTHVKTLSATSCQSLSDEYIAYYQQGKWEGCPSGYKYSSAAKSCVSKTNKEDTAELTEVDTGFLSAAKSCSSLEQALISSRDQMFAKFQDQLTNYLNDNMAKLIKKEAKGETTITNAVSSLVSADAGNKATIVKVKADAEKTKIVNEAEAEKIKLTAKADATKLKAEATKAQIEADLASADAEVKKLESKAKITSLKKEAMQKLVSENKSKLVKECDNAASAIAFDANFTKNMNNLSVCLNEKGKIVAGACPETETESQTLSCIDDIGLNSSAIVAGRLESVSSWKELRNATSSTSGTLGAGFYKVEIGGRKGSGRGSAWDGPFCKRGGGSGGNGDVQVRAFALEASKSYTVTIGGSSKFTISGVVDASAAGGGDAGRGGCGGKTDNGSSAGNGKNSGGGYVKIFVPG